MRNIITSVIIAIIIVLLTSSAAYLYIDGDNLKKYMAAKDRELDLKILQTRETFKNNIVERYKADMELYEDMYKKFEAEKAKVRDMKKNMKEFMIKD